MKKPRTQFVKGCLSQFAETKIWTACWSLLYRRITQFSELRIRSHTRRRVNVALFPSCSCVTSITCVFLICLLLAYVQQFPLRFVDIRRKSGGRRTRCAPSGSEFCLRSLLQEGSELVLRRIWRLVFQLRFFISVGDLIQCRFFSSRTHACKLCFGPCALVSCHLIGMRTHSGNVPWPAHMFGCSLLDQLVYPIVRTALLLPTHLCFSLCLRLPWLAILLLPAPSMGVSLLLLCAVAVRCCFTSRHRDWTTIFRVAAMKSFSTFAFVPT